MSKLMPRQTLQALSNCHATVAALVEDAFRKLGEAKRLMNVSLGQSHDSLFHDRISDYWLDEPDKPTSAMREALTTIQENFWRYTLQQTGVRDIMDLSAGSVWTRCLGITLPLISLKTTYWPRSKVCTRAVTRSPGPA